MSDQLSMFLNALTDQNVATLGEAADWLAGKSWQDRQEIADMIYMDGDDSLKESFDLKDLQHEFNEFRKMVGDDNANLENLVAAAW